MTWAYYTEKAVFDVNDNDIYWCTADIGWITGHTYIVYGPLIRGITSLMYEGTPDYPQPDRWWDLVEKYKVTIIYTSPTAIRMHMKFGGAMGSETQSNILAATRHRRRTNQP